MFLYRKGAGAGPPMLVVLFIPFSYTTAASSFFGNAYFWPLFCVPLVQGQRCHRAMQSRPKATSHVLLLALLLSPPGKHFIPFISNQMQSTCFCTSNSPPVCLLRTARSGQSPLSPLFCVTEIGFCTVSISSALAETALPLQS